MEHGLGGDHILSVFVDNDTVYAGTFSNGISISGDGGERFFENANTSVTQFSLRVFNRGGAAARVSVISKHRSIVVDIDEFELMQAHASGDSKRIPIFGYPRRGARIGTIELRSENLDNDNPYIDRHEVLVVFQE